MLPVLLQNLIKRNKGKYKAVTTSKEEHHSDKFGTFFLCLVFVMVLIGLLLG
jgi:hypothetical protein